MDNVKIKKAAGKLHVELREAKISEKDKILLVNSILVALNDINFRNRYKTYEQCETSQELMDDICGVVDAAISKTSCEQLVKERVIARLQNIYAACFALYAPEKKYSLQYFVRICYTELNCISDEPCDAAGMLYHEFIRYSAGNRTSLGIVLTPSYISDFMAELIDIDNHSSVLDICCGSGSLLSSAYKRSLLFRNDDSEVPTFTGCELDEDTYFAALMSMILQGNQESTVFLGDTFSSEIQSKLRKRRYNKSLLNPPYAQISQNEFLFMMLALDLMEEKGELAVVCPSSCATGKKFKKERKEIMQHHTLKAVFTMPEDIFVGNGASVNACIMIWEAHRPHNPTQPTYFGYCKDKKTRRFRAEQWNDNVKRWLYYYRNKITVEGESTMHCVTDTDEWLCEGYMETDYSNLTKKDFEDTLLEYLAYTIKSFGASNQL